MHLNLIKFTNKQHQDIRVEIQSYSSMATPPSLLIVTKGGIMDVKEDNSEKPADFMEIFKVQFICSCITETVGEIVAAFFYDDQGELRGHPLSDPPLPYHANGSYRVVDYKSYSDICELTGEKKMGLMDYLDALDSGIVGINSIMKYNGKTLNFDGQKELWKKTAPLEA